jgi:HEPN domain
MGDDFIPDDVVGPDRTLRQMFNLFFGPEIERRQAAGLIPVPFELQKAQVLFVEGRPPEVRLNDEVTLSMAIQAPRTVQPGDIINEAEIENIEAFELEQADSDAGHFTILPWKGGWRLLFDFRRNKGKAADLVKRAEEFLIISEYALAQKLFGPFIDNLFSACELLAKARLITAAAEAGGLKSHGVISSRINQWGRLGNVDGEFVKTFNKLSQVRSTARYSTADVSRHGQEEYLATARAEAADLKRRLARFGDDN